MKCQNAQIAALSLSLIIAPNRIVGCAKGAVLNMRCLIYDLAEQR
jgi:hypothetical protein